MKDELNFVAQSSMTLPHNVYRMQLEKVVESTGVHRQSGIPAACTTPQRGQLDDCRHVQASRAACHQRGPAVDERHDDPIPARASTARRANAKRTQTCQLARQARA
jgi:hypothetical protein